MPKYLDETGLRTVWQNIENLNDWMPANAAAHNSIYRGKNITSQVEYGTIYEAIASGTFDDVFVGDYFIADFKDVSTGDTDEVIVSDTAVETVFRVMKLGRADIGNGEFANYALILPDTSLGLSPMNLVQAPKVKFCSSYMYTEVLPKVQTQLESLFSLVNIFCTFADGTYDSPETSVKQTNIKLLSEVEVYGTFVHSSGAAELGSDCGQLPGFALNSGLIRNIGWLRSFSDDSSGNMYCYCDNADNSATIATQYASLTMREYRPAFYLGINSYSEG